MFGCGSESSGSLSVAAPKASNGVVTAIATFTPSSGTALSGQGIKFRWYTVGATSKTLSPETLVTSYTDKSGSATSQFTLPVNRLEDYIVYTISSTGDLTNKEGWQSVNVAP